MVGKADLMRIEASDILASRVFADEPDAENGEDAEKAVKAEKAEKADPGQAAPA